MNMKWLGKPFYDHPPMGMWLMAAAFKIFGVDEFAARLPSALLGLGTILFVYATAHHMFGKKSVGFTAALVVATSVWFVARARSGNLDTIFTFFYMGSIYAALRSVDNPRWLLVAGASFGGLMLSKTLIGVSALPLMLLAALPVWIKPKNIGYLLGAIAIWSIIVLPWYMHHRATYPEFMHHHFTEIGTRNKAFKDYFSFDYAKQVLFYLHMGIRSWYKIWILAVGWLMLRFLFVREYRKEVLLLFVWNVGILFPFLSSERAELWHLIPVYLPVALIIGYGLWDGAAFFSSKLKFLNVQVLYLVFFLLIALKQIITLWPEIIPQYRYESERVQITKALGTYTNNAYLDDDFLPEAIFYAGRDLTPVSAAAQDDPEYKNMLIGLFRTDEKDFIVVTRWWTTGKLDDMKIPYEVLEQNKEFKIISRPGVAHKK